MSQKMKFMLYSAGIMAVLPIVISYAFSFVFAFLHIYPLATVFFYYQAVAFGPPAVILQFSRYLIPGFQLNGGFSPSMLLVTFLFWIIVGIVYGALLYSIQRKRPSEEPKFGAKNFFVVLLSQVLIAYIISFAIAGIYNLLFFR